MKTEIQTQLLELVQACKRFQDDKLPKGCRLHINFSDDWATIWIFNCINHEVGLEVKRMLGIEDAEKVTHNPDEPYHTLGSKLDKNIGIYIECKGLPPMCRVEEYEEEIPKSEIVTLAETVKVKRTRICCGTEAK